MFFIFKPISFINFPTFHYFNTFSMHHSTRKLAFINWILSIKFSKAFYLIVHKISYISSISGIEYQLTFPMHHLIIERPNVCCLSCKISFSSILSNLSILHQTIEWKYSFSFLCWAWFDAICDVHSGRTIIVLCIMYSTIWLIVIKLSFTRITWVFLYSCPDNVVILKLSFKYCPISFYDSPERKSSVPKNPFVIDTISNQYPFSFVLISI